MTKAVCVECGHIKFGSFTECGECGFLPAAEIDLAYSVALTDHYFDQNTLQKISKNMKAGRPRPHLPADQEKKFLKAVRDENFLKMMPTIIPPKRDGRDP